MSTCPKRRIAKRRRKPVGLSLDDRAGGAVLEMLACRVLGVPYLPTRHTAPVELPRDRPLLPLPPFSDSERWLLVDILRGLTEPRVLSALIRANTPLSKRGPPVDRGRFARVALDAEISGRPKDAAAYWGIGRSRLHELHAEHRRDPNWRQWATLALRMFRVKVQHLPLKHRRREIVRLLREWR